MPFLGWPLRHRDHGSRPGRGSARRSANDDVAGIVAALGDRPEPEAQQSAAVLLRNSPTALVVALRALREARQMSSLEDALQQELRIALYLLHGHDFAEGIRAQPGITDLRRRERHQMGAMARRVRDGGLVDRRACAT